MADAVARAIDVINTAPRFSAADVATLNARFGAADTQAMLETIFADELVGRPAVISSFGAESAVLLHLVASVAPAVPVLFLDTGKHFPETLAYRDLLIDRLGLRDVRTLTPDPAVIAQRDDSGLRWSYDPDGCCEIRKVAPLAAALSDFDASLTGRKGFQAATRTNLASFEIDRTDAAGRLKINPLAGWSTADLATYVAVHDLPAHPLAGSGYPSIGCAPCTSKVLPGEDARAGRWRGWDKVECGIHVPEKAG